MTAFGPYAAKQCIDFGALGGRNFFLIAGPTGAGKTALLDAICFALYGDTSGAERDARQMRSDHAAPDVVTAVTFDFALANDAYRVTRSPEQLRASRRGDGLAKQVQKASLWKRTGRCDEDEGELLASKVTEVNDRVERLMGFTSSEFRQVVVLPQGRFRRLLTSDSAEREKILETLFSTEDYRRIQEALKQRARAMEVENAKLATRRQEVLDELRAENREELTRRLEEMNEELEERKEQVAALVQARAVARARLDAGRKAAEALADLERARAALAKIESGAEAVAARREALARARLALPLRETLRHRDDAAKQADAAACSRRGVEMRLRAGRALHEETAEALRRESAREPARRTAADTLHRLQSLAGKSSELAGARRRLAQTETRAARVEHAIKVASGKLAAFEHQEKTLQEELRALRAAAGQMAAHAQTVAALESQRQARATLEAKRSEAAGAETRHATLIAEVEAAENSLHAAKGELGRLQHAWDVGQAAVLAAELEDETPCPVCGSIEHPAPASSSEDTPRQEQIESARGACEGQERRLAAVRTQASEATSALTAVRSQVTTIAEHLGARADEELDSLAQATEEAKKLLAASQSAAERVASGEKRVVETGAALAEERRRLDEARKALSDVKGELGAARTVVERVEAELPEYVREPDALARATSIAVEKRNLLETALERARKQAADADKSRAALATELESAKKAENEAIARLEDICTRLTTALEAAGFDDERQLRDALIGEAEMDSIDARIKEHERALAAARAGHAQAQDKAAGVERPDLEALEKSASQADATHQLAVRREADAGGRLQTLVDRLQRLDVLDGQRAELGARYRVFGRIAKLAEGHNEPGVPFHRFVLAALLDTVLWAASERLRIMSNNRYTLRRSTERGTRRKAQGLELEVDDAYTGVGRPVATLSGGEGFLASLSLALGLADVVQQESGGIRLDAIFVDEGFGTLDPEALDLAIRALLDLQAGGRMVGIISHVPELKERIAARLDIQPGMGGSRAEFALAPA